MTMTINYKQIKMNEIQHCHIDIDCSYCSESQEAEVAQELAYYKSKP